MGAPFPLDHRLLAADPRFATLAQELAALGPIESTVSFNHYCREACRLWPEAVGGQLHEFQPLLDRVEKSGEGVIPTGWGGVLVTLHRPPQVEKFLVIRKGGYLALERHELKDEHLEVREGAGLVLWRRTPDEPLAVEALAPGARFHFEPGREHCLIGAENLLVFERSTDPKGMDRDLIFLYEPL